MHPKQKQLQEEHILVCLSTAPSNAKNIRTAAQMRYCQEREKMIYCIYLFENV